MEWDEEGNLVVRGARKKRQHHGKWTFLDENGILFREIWFYEGNQHGDDTIWYENGIKKSMTTCVNGKVIGKPIYWDESGNEVAELPEEPYETPVASELKCKKFVNLIAAYRNSDPFETKNYKRSGFDEYYSLGGSNNMLTVTEVHQALGRPAKVNVRQEMNAYLSKRDWIYVCKDGNVYMEVYYDDLHYTVGFLNWVYVKYR